MADTVDTELGQSTDTPAQEQPQPHPALRALDVLVGTWRMSGPDVHGQVSFEWLEGGFYLVQRVDINHAGNDIRGLECIGYDPAADNLHSYFFGNTGPGPFGTIALEYVWEVADDTLTIWGGAVGSPAYFKGTVSDDHNTVTGGWHWPGGGYDAAMTRV